MKRTLTTLALTMFAISAHAMDIEKQQAPMIDCVKNEFVETYTQHLVNGDQIVASYCHAGPARGTYSSFLMKRCSEPFQDYEQYMDDEQDKARFFKLRDIYKTVAEQKLLASSNQSAQ